MSSPIRITGMASGLDVDSIVKQLMTAANVPLDKIKQDKQITQWKQDSYRDTLGDINTLKSSYFDVLKSDTNMLSSNNYAAFDVTSIDGVSSTAVPSVTATAGTGVLTGTYIVSNVTLAATANSNSVVTNISQGDNIFPATGIDFTGLTDQLNIKINGVNNLIKPNGNDTSILQVVADINDKINTAGLSLKIQAQASPDGTKIQFSAKTNDSFNISNVNGGIGLGKLGYTLASFDINQSVNDKATNMFNGPTATAAFTIQSDAGAQINFNYDFSATGAQNNWSFSQVLNDISSKAGVNATYNQLSRTFSLSSMKAGSIESINVNTDTNGFMNKLFGTTAGTAINGTDASATIKNPQGVTATVIKGSNNFSIDGVNYNLVKNNATATNVTITSNSQKTFDKIKTFIDKYNEMIGKISSKLSEKRQKGFPPLTDDQRKAMTVDQIKIWEDQAKQGLLRNDSNLQNMLTTMRSAFYTSVQGAGISLSSVGLSTSADYTQGGKIIIDETKLKVAIQNNGQQVANLFMKQSNSQPSYSPDLNSTQRTDRSNEEGIFQKINDTFQDYTTTLRNSNGKKGLIVEQAGIKGDFTEFNNLLSQQIKDKDKAISDFTKKLKDKETAYYTKFSKLETAMQKLNSQSSWLSQQVSKM